MSDTQRPKLVMISSALPEAVPEHAGGRLLTDIVTDLLPRAQVSVIVADGPAVRRAQPMSGLHRVIRVPRESSPRRAQVGAVYERFIATGAAPRWFQRALHNHSEALELLRTADIIDLQWQEQAVLIPWLRRINPGARIALTLHDVNSQRETRALQAVRGEGIRAMATRARWVWARRRAVKAETKLVGGASLADAADAVAVLSQKDADLLPAGSAPVTVVSPPLAQSYAHVRRDPQAGRADLLLVAYLARWANEQGLSWFVERVLPLIRAAYPHARLRVAGTGIRPTVAELAREHGVELLGFVDDLTDLYRTSHVAVVPLLQGAGVKFKVIDAISAGIPVVTTPVGIEGIGTPEWFAGVSADPRQFADAVIAVLRQQGAAEKRARNAREQLRETYSRESFGGALRRVYGLDEQCDSGGPDPDVTVVIPAYNAAAVIERQLAALEEQVAAPRFEVVVADNRSTDGTASVVQRWSTRFPGGLRVVKAYETQGVSHARNVGISHARAPYALICDADDRVATNWVAEMFAALQQHDLVGSAAHQVSESAPGLVSAVVEPVQSGWGYLPYVLGGAMGVRRCAWAEVRGFDQAFPAGHEEVDFCWRVQEAGYTLAGVASTYVQYTQPESLRKIFRQFRNYALGAMLLWTRFADHAPVPPVSFVGSVQRAAGQTLKNWRLFVGRADPQTARDVGWAWGTVLGHVKYRKLGKPPAPQLWRSNWLS